MRHEALAPDNTYNWHRGDIFTKQGKNLIPSWKKSFIGLTESQVMAKLEADKAIYNIWDIDVYRSPNNWCRDIYVNYGAFHIRFDKHTRRVVYAG